MSMRAHPDMEMRLYSKRHMQPGGRSKEKGVPLGEGGFPIQPQLMHGKTSYPTETGAETTNEMLTSLARNMAI